MSIVFPTCGISTKNSKLCLYELDGFNIFEFARARGVKERRQAHTTPFPDFLRNFNFSPNRGTIIENFIKNSKINNRNYHVINTIK